MDLRRLTWAASMAAGIVFRSAPVLANWINLAAGSGGTIMVPAQSYNENRGVNITVIGPNALHVQSMRLDGLNVYGTASLSARIYNGSCAVIASGSATTSGGNHLSVTIPISGTLAVGQSYRLAIDVLTTPMWQGSGDLFVNNHFPYVEPSGNLRINNASDGAVGACPTLPNLAVPQMSVFTGPSFAGTPGSKNCRGQSVAALSKQFGSIAAAAAALGFPSVKALQDAIGTFCRV